MLGSNYRFVALVGSLTTLLASPDGFPKERHNIRPVPTKVKTLRPIIHYNNSPTIYLSFDDGPCEASRYVNEIAAKNNIPIDVFLIGSAAVNSDKSQRLLENYRENSLIEIGNHSYYHAHLKYQQFYTNTEGVLEDIDRNRDTLHLRNNMVRLPGRNFFRLGNECSHNDRNNGKEAADSLSAHGYKIYGWDLEWRRQAEKGISTHTGAQMLEIVANMLQNQKTFLPHQVIILLHDRDLKDETFRAELQNFVTLALSGGQYRFAHLSECDTTSRASH